MLAALAAIAAIPLAANIVWKPKQGVSYNYKSHAVFHKVQGPTGTVDITFDEKMVATNKEIQSNGNVVIETKHNDFKVLLGEVDAIAMGAPIPKEINETVIEKPNGEIISTTSDAPKEMQSPRMDAISSFIYPGKPVSIGDTWSHSVKGDRAKATFDTLATFKYVAEETVGSMPAFKVEMNYKETNAPTNITATGTFWVAESDGELLKAQIAVKNADVGGGMPPADGDLSVERM